MPEKAQTKDVADSVATAMRSRTLVPFTGGLFIGVWAFVWPESYGRWLGTIVGAFRQAAGL